MNVAASADLISPLPVGAALPNGPLVTMDGQKTTLFDVVQGNPAVIIFYRGSW